MQRRKLVLIGGGGHCKACIDVIEQTNCFEITGVLDQPHLVGTQVLGYPVIGTDDDIFKYHEQGNAFLITVGQIKSSAVRRRIYEQLMASKAELPSIVSPKAYVSRHAAIGSGTIIMHQAVVNAGASIGQNCIVNTGAAVEHESGIGNHTHLSTFSVVNGNCSIGEQVFVGSHATVVNGINVESCSIIGAGAVIIKNIDHPGTYIGNPARKVSS
jgi:sugar O-acyltransferase (sialic acid O-acetyltransferase NeuD family)